MGNRLARVLGNARRVALGGLLACALPVVAQTIQHSNFPPNPGVLPGGGWKFTSGTSFGSPPPARSWVNGVYGARTLDALTLAGRGGPLAVTAATTMSWPAVGGAVARCIALVNPYCVAASAAVAVYSAVRIAPDGQGGLLRDPGTAPVSQTTTQWGADVISGSWPSASAACEAGARQQSAGVDNTLVSWSTEAANATQHWCSFVYRVGSATPTTVDNAFLVRASTVTGPGCPASIDASNPAYNVPAGSPIGSDGKCPTARYNHAPITPAGAAEYFPANPGQQGVDAAKNAMDAGQTIPGTVEVSGPSSQQGTPSTSQTTGPNGTTTTTKTPTYTYNYNGDTINYGPVTTVTTITNNEGSTTTTEVSEQKPTETDCDKYPSSLGCMEAGTTPDVDVPEEEVTVTITPTTGWGAENASCPAPRTFTVSGNTFEMSFQPVCDFATVMRYVILAVAWIGAAFIVVGHRND